MIKVGIRELKNKLSEYVRLVRGGEAVLVTDRGTPVAELRPPGGQIPVHEIPPGLLELVRSRELSAGRPNDAALYETGEEPLLRGISSQELLDGERGTR